MAARSFFIQVVTPVPILPERILVSTMANGQTAGDSSPPNISPTEAARTGRASPTVSRPVPRATPYTALRRAMSTSFGTTRS